MVEKLREDLKKLADPKRALILQRFFKTGKGEYGEGDMFLGIPVPQSRKIAQKYKNLSLDETGQLLKSQIHEERLIALFILVHNFKDLNQQKEIYDFYLKNTKYINNWDLVDSSAGYIVGGYLKDKPKGILIKLAKSKNLWEKRIAIISTFYFIKFQEEYEWTFKIAEILLSDTHDLIQKGVGWMLREVGKNISQKTEEKFLKKHYQKMPRTMLRYAIEHFDPKLKAFYMFKSSFGKT